MSRRARRTRAIGPGRLLDNVKLFGDFSQNEQSTEKAPGGRQGRPER
jgi:hypothetical protein